MSDPRCKCPMTISVTGDGCRYCQPQSYIDSLEEWLDEERARVAELEQAVSVPNSEYIRALQDAFGIIQADANTEENYDSLRRIGSVLANIKAKQ